MSASKLFPYKMKKNTWYRADDITESDIAVIVDTKTDTIWFYEGTRSSARNRSNAREILGQLKKKYVPYKFQRVTKNSPEDIIQKLEELKARNFTGKIPGLNYEIKEFSRIFYYLSFVASVLVLISMIYMIQGLTWSEVSIDNYAHYSVDYNLFILYKDFISYSALSGFLIFIISAIFGFLVKKNMFSIVWIIAAILLFIAFFMLRIWDIILFYKLDGQNIVIRKDALILFILCLEFLIGQASVLGIIVGVIGIKNKEIEISEKVEKVEKIEKVEKSEEAEEKQEKTEKFENVEKKIEKKELK